MIQMHIKLESLLHLGSPYDAIAFSRATESYVKDLWIGSGWPGSIWPYDAPYQWLYICTYLAK